MNKKKKILVTALSILTGGVVLSTQAISKSYLANGEKCSHANGNHYSEYAATYDHSGIKEYWVCCDCHEHYLIEPSSGNWNNLDGVENTTIDEEDDRYIVQLEHKYSTEWSYDDTSHWHECLDEGYSTLTQDFGDHIDEDGDLICDVCEYEIEGIKISLSHPLTMIGTGEKMKITANVVKSNGYTGSVSWKLSSTTYFSITDNKDGTATISAKASTSTTTRTVTVTCTSKEDTSISATTTVQCSTYGSAKIKAVDDFVGKDNRLPYFTISNNYVLSADGTYVYSYTSTASVYDVALAAFENNGTYEKRVEGTKTYFTKDAIGDDGFDVEYCVYKDGGKVYVECRRIDDVRTSFPVDLVTAAINGKSTSAIIEPTGVDKYTYSTKGGLTINAFGDYETFISQLNNANYYVLEDDYYYGTFKCVSPERTLQITIEDCGDYYTIKYSTLKVPTGTDWSNSDKAIMNAFCGEVLPYVNADFGAWYDYSTSYGYITTSSLRVDAYFEAIKVFDADGSFVGTTQGTTHIYTKANGEYSKIVVTITTDGYIKVTLELLEVTEWKASEIALALGDDAFDTLIPASGTAYTYKFDNNNHKVTIGVSGQDYQNYISSLVNANYTLKSEGYYDSTYVSPTGTLTVVITPDYYEDTIFTISVTASLPENVSRSFPTDKVKAELKLSTSDSIPTCTGTLFTFTDTGDFKCDVLVSGASKTDYIELLVTSGFELNASSQYVLQNLVIGLADGQNGDFIISFSLVSNPQVVYEWSDEAKSLISESLSWYGFTFTTIPHPTTFTSIDVDTYNWKIKVYGGNLSEYLQQLVDFGFTIDDSSFESTGYYFFCEGYSGLPIKDCGSYLLIDLY